MELAKSRESPYFGIFPTVEFFGDLRYVTDFFSCFIIYQRKSFIKFSGILFDVSEELLTVKTS